MKKYPVLKKAQRIVGKNIVFRDVCLSDACFILALRTDTTKSRYLSSVSNQLSAQEEWIKKYALRDNEAYFIIENKEHEQLGTIRLYNAVEDSFCWGSWIIKNGVAQSVAIESALMVYAYGLDVLNFSTAYFQVNKENKRVCLFHERFGAVKVAENETEYEYIISNEAIRRAMEKYKRYLPISSLVVEY